MSLPLAASVGGAALKAWREKGPTLFVDAHGITDNFHLQTHLARASSNEAG